MSQARSPNALDEDSPLLQPRRTPAASSPPTPTGSSHQFDKMAILATLAAVYGGTGVMLGAFGAHGLKSRISDPARLQSWGSAAQYQLIHSVATLVVASLAPQTRATRWAGGLFVAGMTMFSGSIYLLVLDPKRFKALGPVTPLGGLCFIAGWAALAVGSRGRAGLGALGAR